MDTMDFTSRQAHKLIQWGILLFLLGLLTGLVVPLFKVPRLGLSVHLLGILQGIFLMVIGLLWDRVRLNRTFARIVFWLAIYGCCAAWTANLLAGIWGAGNTMLPIAAGQAHGSLFQETLIAIVLRTAALSLISSVVMILWGLRAAGQNQRNS
jgi:(hydroxyamino)benzene mutase